MPRKSSVWPARPTPHGAAAQRLHVDERPHPATTQRPAAQVEQVGEHDRAAEADPGPGRPAQPLALDEREHQRGERGDGEQRLGRIDPRRAGDPGVRQQSRGEGEGGQPDRHVDQEDRAPAEAEDVRLDQQPADQLAGRRGHAHHGRVGAAARGPGAGRRTRRRSARARCGMIAAAAAPCATGPRAGSRRRAPAPQIAEVTTKRAMPTAEHPASAPAVGDPAGDEQQGAERQAVAGDEPLECGVADVEVVLHRRQRDVDDEEVEDDQEDAGQQDRRGPVLNAGQVDVVFMAPVLRPPAAGESSARLSCRGRVQGGRAWLTC